ncbi:MAG: ATP-binding protein [Planctomycetota bacterium]
MMATLTALLDPGEFTSVLQNYNDVTERLMRSHELLSHEVCRLREELQEKNKELQRQERLAALGEMAAGVAHEIRNPLGGIGLYGSLLERDLGDRPVQLDLVRRMQRGVRTLESVVGDILAFAGESEPHLERVLLSDILDGAVSQAESRAVGSGVVLDVAESLRVFSLFCDPWQIERAILNLLLNAIDASNGGGHVWIRDEGREFHQGALVHGIAVEDEGSGIDPTLLDRVFNPFFTTKHTGTGLGLAIVHRIAASHGGSARAENRAGGGAKFTLLLPIAGRDEKTIQGGDR